ncbi:MAG: hypothetical protein AAF998_18695, partial [Bacteroidota bacterium]
MNARNTPYWLEKGEVPELAQTLIEQEKRERSGGLDLGNCGLRAIPREVWEEMPWLRWVNFSVWGFLGGADDYGKTKNQGAGNHLQGARAPPTP